MSPTPWGIHHQKGTPMLLNCCGYPVPKTVAFFECEKEDYVEKWVPACDSDSLKEIPGKCLCTFLMACTRHYIKNQMSKDQRMKE